MLLRRVFAVLWLLFMLYVMDVPQKLLYATVWFRV
jgi:hypothetical protein